MEPKQTVDTSADGVVWFVFCSVLEVPEGTGRNYYELKGGHQEGSDPKQREQLVVAEIGDFTRMLERTIRIVFIFDDSISSGI